MAVQSVYNILLADKMTAATPSSSKSLVDSLNDEVRIWLVPRGLDDEGPPVAHPEVRQENSVIASTKELVCP